MSKRLLFVLSFVALAFVSCDSLTLSKKEALECIRQRTGVEGVHELSMTIPHGLRSQNDLTRKYSNIDAARYILGIYENAGLITMKDSTYSYRQWGSVKTVNAVDIHLTSLGRESLISETDKEVTVKNYSYTYNKVVKIKSMYTKNLVEVSGTAVAQMVYFSGNVIEASPFANVMNINAGDYYPLCEDKDEVQATVAWGYYRGPMLWGMPLYSKLINASIGSFTTIKRSAIEEYYNEAWVNMARTGDNY